MKKLNFLLFLFIPFIFMSCIDPWIDMEVTTCQLDKETYKLGEDIVFLCSGYFPEANLVSGNLALKITFSKEIDGDGEEKLYFDIIDSGGLKFDIDYYNEPEDNTNITNPKRTITFYTELIDNSDLTDFNQKIVFRPKEQGIYTANIYVMSSSLEYIHGQTSSFTIPFTVEAE